LKIKKFVADSVKQALLLVKEEFGDDAIILKTSKLPNKSILGFNELPKYEITAAIDSNLSESIKDKGINSNGPITQKLNSNQTSKNREGVSYQPSNPGPYGTSSKKENVEKKFVPNTESNFYDEVNKMGNDQLEKDKFVLPKDNISRNNISPLTPNDRSVSPEEIGHLIDEVSGMKDMLRKMTEKSFKENFDDSHKNIQVLYNILEDKEFDESFIIQLLNKIEEVVDIEKIEDLDYLKQVVEANISKRLSFTAGFLEKQHKKPFVVAMVGPTGVGKTTTIAKLASIYKLIENKQVGIISVDTYRIAAVEQLKTFAGISSIPFVAAYNKEVLKDSIDRFKGFDIIFIDTAGRSPKNISQIEESTNIFDSVEIDEFALLISATTKLKDMIMVYENFSLVNLGSVIFSKLDETSALGNVFNFNQLIDLPISYLTIGQNVPDDILGASKDKLTEMLME